ncbi:putative ribosome biogenesis protein Bms1/Tsr1 [Helianthus anomalus]
MSLPPTVLNFRDLVNCNPVPRSRTGVYPQRVSKSKAAVRYMFHNPEDVKWFKPVEVWTKLGRRGRIKEPVGTHGMLILRFAFFFNSCNSMR